jgi:hypothetical protein
MTTVRAKSAACGVTILGALALASSLQVQTGIGTWVKQAEASARGAVTMTIEACCHGGHRVTYRAVGTETVMTIQSPFDGSDAPLLVGGKPSGETMGIKWVDGHHTITVLKMNGQTLGTSKATFSADGKTITIEDEYTSTAGGQPVGKQTEIWVRK